MPAKPSLVVLVLLAACDRGAPPPGPVAPTAVAPAPLGAKPAAANAQAEPVVAAVAAEPARESGCIYADEKPAPKPEGCPHEEEGGAARLTQAPGAFGVPITAGDPTPLARALGGELADGATVKVSGVIDQVCQKMGCWMVLKDGEQTARVLMKDHGFTIPVDSRGKAAVVEGTVKVRTFNEAQVKHLEEDAGRDPSKVSGTRREVVLTAAGVKIGG